MRTNQAGDLAQRLRKVRGESLQRAAAGNAALQQRIGADLAARGRTPQRDAQGLVMNYIRQMGIGI